MITRRIALLFVAAALVVVALPRASSAHTNALDPPVVTVTCAPAGPAGNCSGWFKTNVTVTFAWATPPGESFYAESGCNGFTVTSDTTGASYSCVVTLQDGTGATVGNAPLTGSIKRDTTPPTASAIGASRSPDANGWYNHALGVTVSGSDATSGIASCTSVTYGGPDSSSASVSGTCTDNAGNVSAPTSTSFKYDATPPSLTPAPSRNPDANGWYNREVDVAFKGSDTTSGVANCTSSSYAGPDSGGAMVTGTCTDQAGNVGSASFALKYDSTPPAVTSATPDRPPDAGEFYNHKVVVTFAGGDATSGIASCDVISYDKPDSASAKVTGVCHDNAGNMSAPAPFAFKYDSTPPKLTDLTVAAVNGGANLSWKPSPDVSNIVVTRTAGNGTPRTVYSGKRITTFADKNLKNGVRYVYTVIATDDAGNTATVKTAAQPSAPLIAPRQQEHVHGSVLLRWHAAPRAGYYNVQLWYLGRKVLSIWPSGTSYRVARTWSYLGRSYSLTPGRYTWFVWPGRSKPTAHLFGPLLGSSSFVVTR